ncbi:hypothetical protein F4692_001948 [Nocardioides cavernae]|uniref:Bacterial Ig-like domain-containing protein n=1 Tax=Nocardioides cavernae TaxID=1921566 RepID=A0A7Y9H2M7_9ACTN|nr:Ig-like domain-containing protein [Nocardioides cavernae]NYE36815.1 hypothetical protein [Nocardioides cavernae]
MSMPQRPWTRLVRVATATVFSVAGAVALMPSAASAADDPAPGAIVDLPGCTENSMPGGSYTYQGVQLSAPLNVHGGSVGTVNVHNHGIVSAYGDQASLNIYPIYSWDDTGGDSYSATTYGQTMWEGHAALCMNWLDLTNAAGTFHASSQALIVDRSDLQPGDYDVVINVDTVHQPATAYAYIGYSTYRDANTWQQSQDFIAGSGYGGLLDDANTATGAIHRSRESDVLGRYVYRFRNGQRLDTPAPDTTIEAKPADRSSGTGPAFTYDRTGSADHLRFECRLHETGATAGDFATCDDEGTSYDDLADGSYVFEVRAVDTYGGTDASPATATFEVDTTGPVVKLDETPSSLTNDNVPFFTWSSPDADVDDEAYSCHLDRTPSAEPSPWWDCTSGEEITNLGDGDWRFQVKGHDDLGNEGEAVSYDFTIDTDAPVVELTEKPAARGNVTSPAVAWTSADDVDFFECTLDRTDGEGSPWHECASGDELDVTDGDWTFQVRATDVAGNEGEPTSYAFTVDTEKSSVTLTATPKALGNDATPFFGYAADPSTDLDHFMCAVVPVGAQHATPVTCAADGFTSEPLTDGDYHFAVVAVDSAGNESDPASFDFTVDTVAPETTVTSGPAATIGTGAASFGFASSETPATFECRISAATSAAWQPCDGTSKAFTGLTDGTWTFEVRATDAAGNTDATPAARPVKVNLGQPTITAAVSSPTPVSEHGWYRDAVTITYTCNGNGSPLVGACPAPRQVPRAQQGKVVFRAGVTTADGDTASVSTTLFIDKGKPQARIRGFDGRRSYSSMPKPRCKASDPRSGLADCTVSVTKVKRKNGAVFVVVKATATDKAGNVRVVKKQAPFRAA